MLGWRAIEMGWQQNHHWHKHKESEPHPAVKLGLQPLLPLNTTEQSSLALHNVLGKHAQGTTTSTPPAGCLQQPREVHWMSLRCAILMHTSIENYPSMHFHVLH